MRLWSLHPKYLDRAGLTAVWREALLAQAVLAKKTKTRAYSNHPQLARFKAHPSPLSAIRAYLHFICDEAQERGYNFSREKAGTRQKSVQKIKVTRGQLEYEFSHLLKKLKKRAPKKAREISAEIKKEKIPQPNPLFRAVKGEIEDWERVHARG